MKKIKWLLPDELISQRTAEEFAIRFAEWILINNFEMRDDNHENWWGKFNEEKDYSSKELLEIYKKENKI